MPPRRNVADVLGGGLQRAAAQFTPLFKLLQSNQAESEADNFARKMKLLELDLRVKASTRASRQVDISAGQLEVSQGNLALRKTAADVVKPPTVAGARGRVAAGEGTPEDIAGLTQLRSIETAKPGAVGDVSKTIPDLESFDKRGAALKKEKAAFESKQALLDDVVWDRQKGDFVTNLAKTAPWPGSLPTAADSVRAVRTTATKHNVPVEEVVEAWSGIEPAFEKLFQEAKRAAPIAGIPQFPVTRGTAGAALSRTIGPPVSPARQSIIDFAIKNVKNFNSKTPAEQEIIIDVLERKAQR